MYSYKDKSFFEDAKKGDLRIWWMPQVPSDNPFLFPVQSVSHAVTLYAALAQYDLYQLDERIKLDFSNAGGLEQFDGREWCEYEDEDGFNISDFAEEKEEEDPDIVFQLWFDAFMEQAKPLKRDEVIRVAFLTGRRS